MAAVVQGGKGAAPQSNIENLLDIDFDGAAPASTFETPQPGMSGLEGLAGTPQRIASPGVASPTSPGMPAAFVSNMDDLMGLGDMSGGSNGTALSQGNQDIMAGFAGLSVGGSSSQPPPPQQQLASSGQPKQTNEDLLGLF